MAPGSVGSSGSAGSMSAAVGGAGGKKQRRERTSVCSFCNMTFNKKEHLQRHERTHTLDRPYICDFAGCGKTFARRDTLTRHTRLHKREDGDDAAAAAAAGGGPGTGSAPSSSSAPSSLRVPKPARKRRARNGSATSTLAHDDSTENEDGTSSSAEAEAGGPDDDFHLDHKLPAKRLQSMTIAHAAAIKDEDDDDEEEEEAEVKSEFSEEGARQTRQTMVAPPANLGYVPSLLAATNAVVAAEEAKSSFYNWNKYSASKDGAYLIPHSPPASSSLGLDIALPATAGPASFEDNNNNNQQPINHAQNELPGFVQATQHDFRIFRPITSNNHQSIHDLSTQPQPQFQQQSPAQQPGWQQQSFLAGSPGRSNLAQLPQLNPANDPAARRSATSVMNAAAAAPITSPVIGQAAAALPNNSPSTASINISPAGAYQSLPLPIPIAQPPHMQQRPQMAMPNPGHRARQFSMDYSPMDGESSLSRSAYSASPASVDSFLSLGYTGSSPNSVASSLPSLSAAQSTGPWEDLSKDFNVAGYSANPSSGGDMPAAFKKGNNAFTQPLTMGIGLHAWLSGASSNTIPTPTTPAAAAANTAGTAGSMWGRSGADSDTKKHLYMLMRAAETPTDEFLRWPSRDSSPAFGMSTSYSSSSAAPAAAKSSLAGSSSVSSGSHGSARTASSFIDFGEYNSTQAALFGEAAPHSRKDMVVPHSPIASLEQWLGRHGQDMSAESMVF